jgi:hypothetical protein
MTTTHTHQHDYRPTHACGCNPLTGTRCEEAKALWTELLSWILAPSTRGFMNAKSAWDGHLLPDEDCTCDLDPNRETMACPVCRAQAQREEMPF